MRVLSMSQPSCDVFVHILISLSYCILFLKNILIFTITTYLIIAWRIELKISIQNTINVFFLKKKKKLIQQFIGENLNFCSWKKWSLLNYNHINKLKEVLNFNLKR